jgi:HEAT repeat protein
MTLHRTRVPLLFVLLCALAAGAPAATNRGCRVPRERIPDDISASLRRHVTALYSDSQAARADAAFAIGGLGKQAAPAVPFLIGLLQDHGRMHDGGLFVWEHPEVPHGLIPTSPGRQAAIALVRIGDPAVGALLEVLKDEKRSRPARRNAAFALGELEVQEAAGPLANGWKGLGTEAIIALGKIGGTVAVGPLIDALEDQWQRLFAQRWLVQLGRPAVEPLTRALHKEAEHSVEARCAMAVVLADIGDRRAVPALIDAVQDQNTQLTWKAGRALASFADPRSGDVLVSLLDHEDWRVRKVAVDGMGRLGDRSLAAKIEPLLDDPDLTVRGHAALALGGLYGAGTPPPVEIVRGVEELLEDQQRFVRESALEALSGFGSPASAPRITPLLEAPEPAVRRRAAEALARVATPEIAGTLAGLLAAEDKMVRRSATEGLERIGSEAIPAVIAEMTRKENSDNERLLNACGSILAGMGRDAIPQLIELLGHPNWKVQVRASGALRSIGEPAVEPVIRTVKKGSNNQRFRAVQALAQMEGPGVQECLTGALKDGAWRIRWAASRALADRKTGDAVDDLIPLLEDDHRRVREAAQQALEKITGKYRGKDPDAWRRWLDERKGNQK